MGDWKEWLLNHYIVKMDNMFYLLNTPNGAKSSHSCQEPGERSDGILRDHGQHQRELPPDNLSNHGQNLRELPHGILKTMANTKGS